MTNQDVMKTVDIAVEGLDRDSLIEEYLKTAEEVLMLTDELEDLRCHTLALEMIIGSCPVALGASLLESAA